MLMVQEQTRSRKEQLVTLLKQKRRFRGKSDLHYFNKHILGYNDLTAKEGLHGELCDFVSDDSKNHILVLEPRGSLKSSCITIGYALQSIVKDPNIRILIASEQFLTAKKFISEIRGHIEKNPIFRDTYGDFVGQDKWSEAEMTVGNRTLWRKEPTITAAGVDVTKVGLHYDLIIIDDPHSSTNVTTREQIEKVITWYKLVLSLLDPGKKVIVIGTRWHYNDLFGWIIDKEREREENNRPRRFHILKKSAYRGKLDENTPDRRLLWPERLSRQFLLDTKLDQGPYIFSCQYKNEPVDDESAQFKRSWIRFYKPEDVDPSWPVFTTLDPMRDEEGSDYACLITAAMAPDWRSYILEVRRGKWDEYETIDQMFRCHKKWNSKVIGVETVAWQKTYYRFVKAEMLRLGVRLPLKELTTDTRTTKRMRILSMVPYLKTGLFLFPGTRINNLTGNMAILMDEMLRYPKISNDDCIDAMAYLDQLMKRPTVARIHRKINHGSFKATRDRAIRHKEKMAKVKELL